jgi:hypothetical protein
MQAGTPSICGCTKDHRVSSEIQPLPKQALMRVWTEHRRRRSSCERWQLFGREIRVSRNRSCANGGGQHERTSRGELRDSGRNAKRSRRFNSRQGRSDEPGAQELRNEAWAEVRGGRSATPDQVCCYRGNQGGRSDRPAGCVFGAVRMQGYERRQWAQTSIQSSLQLRGSWRVWNYCDWARHLTA